MYQHYAYKKNNVLQDYYPEQDSKSHNFTSKYLAYCYHNVGIS